MMMTVIANMSDYADMAKAAYEAREAVVNHLRANLRDVLTIIDVHNEAKIARGNLKSRTR